jgi:hypothetical protein
MTKQEQRTMLAGMAMQGLLYDDAINPSARDATVQMAKMAGITIPELTGKHATEYADALLAELESTAPKEESIKYDPTPISPSVTPQTVTVLCTVDNAKGWIERIPGDPIPDASMVRFADGLEEDGNGWSEANWNHRYAEHRCRITHYKPA